MNKKIEEARDLVVEQLELTPSQVVTLDNNVRRMMDAAQKDLEGFCTLSLICMILLGEGLDQLGVSEYSRDTRNTYAAGLADILGDEE